ncbi:SDR family NAD(P)-dependent oxidoreductase [Phenylobacterium sp.]|uniref:SDR family NAD(P)-dependent oxidoreductase n=1 Tax=Phenylobacterium sp. TaxID=1871053 RepID=UPI0025EC4F1A|nr:SDR family oxidoreductase [Phenylobacterium sp.]MBX3482013.1 SDR family oxidoreductase [Phenylobacterium sp.]MCW5758239.1 SDR family oxidoreductase [Phenylobacterium sp.]
MSGKVALVTGGSRGLGYEIAKAYALEGADVIVASRKQGACEAVAAGLRALGARAVGLPIHVGDWSALEAFVDQAYAAFGRIDVLVNNAGIAPTAPRSVNVEEALFDKIVAVNFKGPFRLSALVGERMVADGGGAIINVSSIAAIRPEPAYPVYAGAKAALNAMTRSQAFEFGPSVRVNAIMCGPFWTDIAASWREELDKNSPSALKRIGRPEEIASTALYLASDRSSFTTGTIVRLDGGVL